MKKLLSILFFVIAVAVSAQKTSPKLFDRSEYPEQKYAVKTDQYRFKDLTIELIQAQLRDPRQYDAKSAYCRIWLTVKKGDLVKDQLYFNDCEALGGCSGIYVSRDNQPENHFLLSKFGDYDGQIIIIDTKGKIRSFIGGSYYLSTDKKYLFSTYDSDLSGLTVFDFSKDKALFSSDDLKPYLGDFYQSGDSYFALVNSDVKSGKAKIAKFDFNTNLLVVSTVDKHYLSSAKPLKACNVFEYAPCSCGRTKK